MSRFVLTAELSLQAPRNVAQVVQQIQSQLNNVQVNVQVQSARQAQRDLDQLTRSADRANDSFFRMGRTFTASIRRFSALAIATRAVSLLTNTLSAAIEESINFQKEIVRLSQVTGDSISKLSKLTDEITNLATGLGVSSDKLLSVTTILAQAGLSAEDTRIALNALAKTELAPTFGDITETAEGAVAILAQFKLGAGALEQQLGSLNAVSGKFAVESEDLIETIRRTGGVFKAAGGDLNELLALFTSVRATTRESASTIATGLRTIFTRIQRPKTIEYLKQFGVELTDLEGKFVGPYEAIKLLSQALAGLEEGDITFVQVAEELGGFRQIGKVIPLLREFATAQEALKVAQEGSGSLAKDQATAQLALAVQITKVKEQFFALIRGFTETTTFRVMADVILKLASTFIGLAESIQPILPLLTAFAGIRIAQGIGGFLGGVLGRSRGMATGGKVLAFAKGGMVPGTGNSDTVPAMLSPGEFVIRKSSVKKLGAGNLAAMNENRYANGGLVNEQTIGAAILENVGFDNSNSVTISRKEIENKLPKTLRLTDDYPIKSQKKLTLEREGLSGPTSKKFNEIIDNQLVEVANRSASLLSESLGLAGARTSVPQAEINRFLTGINDASRGNLFEDTLKVLSGSPFSTEPQRAFDFETGLSTILKDDYKNLTSKYVDAKSSLDASKPFKFQTKAANALAYEAQKQNYVRQESDEERKKRSYAEDRAKRKYFGGLIQKFARGGMAQAPLVDDIINASGTIMPRPSSAIAALVKAGGGAIDIDRTIKRTIGDKAYGMAKTAGQQSAALDKYFKDPAARLKDIKSAPLTAFGKELQSAIKSKQIQPGKLSIVSKSQRVPGVAEYLSQLFGIPLANMIFTQGGSKQPAMDALRTKGSRSERVARYANGGLVSLYHGSNTGTNDSVLESFKTQGARSDIAQGYGQGAGFYVWSDKDSAKRQAQMRVKAGLGSFAVVKGDTAGRPMVLSFKEMLNSATWDLDYEMNKGSVVQWLANNYDKIQDKVSPKLNTNQRLTGITKVIKKNRDEGIMSDAIEVQNDMGVRSNIYAGTDGNIEEGKHIGQIMNRLKANDPSTVASFEKQFFNSPSLASGDWNRLALKYVGTTPLKPTNIETFATGGGVGTDTVPALLTPGEFVINKSSAQNIGYGNLNRMNKVGRYANGGIVQRFAAGSTGRGVDSIDTSSTTNRGITGLGSLTEGLFAAQMALSYLTPTVDENSSAITRMTASFTSGLNTVLSTITAVNGALQLFGKQLNIQIAKDFFSGKGLKLPSKVSDAGANVIQRLTKSKIPGVSNVATKVASRVGGSFGTMGGTMGSSAISTGLQQSFTKLSSVVGKLSGPILAASAAFYVLGQSIDSLANYQGEANKAIEDGNAAKAGEMQAAAQAQENLNNLGYAAIAAGALIGGPFGAAAAAATVLAAKAFPSILRGAGDFASGASDAVRSLGSGLNEGALKDSINFASDYLHFFGENLDYGAQSVEYGLVQLGVLFGGQTYSSIVAVAEAAALEVNAKKALIDMEKRATQAMKEFTDGNISAYEALQRTSASTQAVIKSSEATLKANKAREGDKATISNGGFLRDYLRFSTFGIAGLLGVESSTQRNAKIDEENKTRSEEDKKRQEEAIKTNEPMTDALARATAAAGGDIEAFKGNLESANPALFKLYTELDPTGERMKELTRRFSNLQAEVERAKKAFEAINLGFQGVNATASALTVGLENYLASQQAGNIGLAQSISTLQAGLTNAAQGISTETFQAALTDAEAALVSMGASGKEVTKFKENMTAINTAQKFYASATEDAKANLMAEFKRGASGTSDPKKRQAALTNAITSQLEGAGIGPEVRKRIGDALAGAKVEDGDLEAILSGNFEVLDKILKDLGDKTFGQVNKALEEYVKYQQQLVKLTQERLKIEGQLRDAQKSVIDSQLEAAKIAQEFGGAAVTPDQNRKAIIDKANIDARGLGVGQLQKGNANEIQARQAKIRQELEKIQNVRTGAAAGNKADLEKLQGKDGAKLADDEERLRKLAQENYNSTKALIDQKREEIKLIQTKNQLEKASMDALISGDIMKFFESQAAIGAQAALATGDQQLISQFDTASLGAATKDLEAQREAGVQQKFGRNIGGAGGLVETGYSAIGGRVGLGMDTIQAAAQTTPEQLQAEKEARELAATLPANMEILSMSAQKDLEAADKQLAAAEKQLEAAKGEVGQSAKGPKQAGVLAKGGMVYASKGTLVDFRPKGTDTVPAMLTPGEFVVNRQSVQRGNNLAILSAMNKGKSAPAATGMSRGGQVKYMQTGGMAQGGGGSGVSINIDVKALQTFSASLTKFNDDLATNIQNLKDTKFQISLSPTNINVNLTGTSFLDQLTNSLKQELVSYVGKEISQYTVGSDGKLKKSGSNLGTGL